MINLSYNYDKNYPTTKILINAYKTYLHEEPEVDILGFGRTAFDNALFLVIKIFTLRK